ncbi:MAG: hypothetical protein AB1847_19680 [bacterium]
MYVNFNTILNNPVFLATLFWWGPALIILFGLYLLSRKFIPYIIQTYAARIEEQTKVLKELQQTMAARSEKEATEHREMLILLKTIVSKF